MDYVHEMCKYKLEGRLMNCFQEKVFALFNTQEYHIIINYLKLRATLVEKIKYTKSPKTDVKTPLQTHNGKMIYRENREKKENRSTQGKGMVYPELETGSLLSGKYSPFKEFNLCQTGKNKATKDHQATLNEPKLSEESMSLLHGS